MRPLANPAEDAVIPFVGRHEVGSIGSVNPERLHSLIVGEKIAFKFRFSYEEAVAHFPVCVQQVFIGMRSKVMAFLVKLNYKRFESGVAVKNFLSEKKRPLFHGREGRAGYVRRHLQTHHL